MKYMYIDDIKKHQDCPCKNFLQPPMGSIMFASVIKADDFKCLKILAGLGLTVLHAV